MDELGIDLSCWQQVPAIETLQDYTDKLRYKNLERTGELMDDAFENSSDQDEHGQFEDADDSPQTKGLFVGSRLLDSGGEVKRHVGLNNLSHSIFQMARRKREPPQDCLDRRKLAEAENGVIKPLGDNFASITKGRGRLLSALSSSIRSSDARASISPETGFSSNVSLKDARQAMFAAGKGRGNLVKICSKAGKTDKQSDSLAEENKELQTTVGQARRQYNTEHQPTSDHLRSTACAKSKESDDRFISDGEIDPDSSSNSISAGSQVADDIEFENEKKATDENSSSSNDNDVFDKNSFPEEIIVPTSSSNCAGILHGAADIKPVNYFGELNLHQNVNPGHKWSKVDLLTRPQQLAMPAILSRRNVIMIAPNNCKKTSGFVIPTVSLLFDEEYYSWLRKGLGPRCVIVAPTSSRVKKLGRLCSAFSGSRLVTITTFGGGLELERKFELSEGCDILVTTPRCWLRLLKIPVVTNLVRLCHLILDDFDDLSNLFLSELKEISAKVEFLSKERNGKDLPAVQTVIVGNHWSPRMEELSLKIVEKPVLVIASFLEASLYARIKPTVSVMRIGGKLNKVQELVKKYDGKKTVVVCNRLEEIANVQTACAARSSFVAHEKMSPSELSDANDSWSCKPDPLLICSDSAVNDLNIADAQVLINYSLPLNKTSFSERFHLLRDYIPDRLLQPEASPPNVTVHILFDETSDEPFPSIVDFLRRIPITIPQKVASIAREIEKNRERCKTDSPFCENILQMGFCRGSGCKERHVVLPKIDQSKDGIDKKKFIKVLILKAHSAVKFSARILSYTDDPKGAISWEKSSSQCGILPMKLSSYFSSTKNFRLSSKVETGDLTAYQSEPGEIVYRAEVRKIEKKNERGEPTVLKIFLIDECDELLAHAHQLYELPENLKKYPPQACYLYLANLKPVDLDTTWNYAALRAVEKAVFGEIDSNLYNEDIIGKVLFCIGQNIVVDNLRWFRQLEFSRFVSCDLRKLILDSECGLPNPEYADNLTLLCKQGDILPSADDHQIIKAVNRTRVIPSQEKDVPPRWAHIQLPQKSETDPEYFYHPVRVTSVRSPSLFFIKLNTHRRSLQELEKSIAAEIEKKKPLANPCIGEYCIVKLSTESKPLCRRCEIQWLEGEMATVFLVDYGNEEKVPLKSLYKAVWNLMIRIPFQAIECSLAGVRPSNKGEWPAKAIDFLTNFTISGGDDIFVKVIAVDQLAEFTGGRRYHVMMVHAGDEECQLLNDHFVTRSWANWESEPLRMEPELRAVLRPKLDAELPIQEPIEEEEGISMDLDEIDDSDLKEFVMALTGLNKETSDVVKSSHEVSTADSCESIVPADAPETEEISDNCVQDAPVNPANPEISLGVGFKYLTPFVRWSQDYSMVSLSYSIPPTAHYRVYPSLTRICFSAIVKSENEGENKVYWSSIDLFGPVYSTGVKIHEGHSSVRVTLKKILHTRAILWPRVTRKRTKDVRISYCDVMEESEDELSSSQCDIAAWPPSKSRFPPDMSDEDDSTDEDNSEDLNLNCDAFDWS